MFLELFFSISADIQAYKNAKTKMIIGGPFRSIEHWPQVSVVSRCQQTVIIPMLTILLSSKESSTVPKTKHDTHFCQTMEIEHYSILQDE